MRRLGLMGYVKGILEKLDEIEHREPACARFIAELRALVKSYRLAAFVERISNASQVTGEQPGNA